MPDPPHGHQWKMVSDTALQPPYDFLDADDIPAQAKVGRCTSQMQLTHSLKPPGSNP
jgi:hypothetical protein